MFDSLDPATGITPFGAFDGFLQVEDETGNGQGFVRYDVQQKPDLPQATEFENQALIIFDLNDPIETPMALHTIDLERPTSSASSPAVSDSASFTGSDPGGSGVAYYTVYQSVDGSPFPFGEEFLKILTLTSLEFLEGLIRFTVWQPIGPD